MKPFITLFFLLVITSCASQKEHDTKNNKTTTKMKDVVLDIRYEARTRGSSKMLYVLENTLTYKTNKESKVVTLSLEEKREIIKIIEKVDLENVHMLKAPTKERMFDGALHALVKIKKKDKEYTSTTFDDGNPPTELKPLVDVLMGFVE